MRFCSIASGSSGNSIYIGTQEAHILVDAGISCKRITEGLKSIDLKPDELSGVFITHEHSDHISGLNVLIKKYQIPVFATQKTVQELRRMNKFDGYDESLIRIVEPDMTYCLGDLKIRPFRISHDAIDPVAYRVQSNKGSMAVATDMGYFDDYIVENLKNLDVAIIEANHDVRMLECGHYPYNLKRRILGDKGHLSNENAGRLISKILHDNIRHLFLGHLSKDNNHPDIAYHAVSHEIDIGDCKYRGNDFLIEVATRDGCSKVVEI